MDSGEQYGEFYEQLPKEIGNRPGDTPGEDSQEEPPDWNAELARGRLNEVKSAIREKNNKKKSWVNQIGVLLITLLIFYQLGARNWGVEGVLIILAVLFVHEAGHYFAMKLFGYTNVQMFFIPLMGAAVSGRSRHAAAWKKAAVTLAGPVPGIFIGFGLLAVYMVLRQEICLRLGLTFVGLNLFNLLPIYPLDGGRFLHEVLFVRNRYLEMISNVLAGLALLGAAAALQSWFLAILGVLNLSTIRYKFRLAKAARDLRAGVTDDQLTSPSDEDEIPDSILEKIINWMSQHMPALQPAATANTAAELWQRIRIRPPGAGATIALLCVLAMGYGVSVLSLGGIAVFYAFNNMTDSKIVEYTADDGTIRYKEQGYFMGELCTETDLTDDQRYYHGRHVGYDFDGNMIAEGQWDMGMKAGVWLMHDKDRIIVGQTNYENGRPVITQHLNSDDGTWTTETWSDYSDAERTFHEKLAALKQGPGISPPIDWYDVFDDPNALSEQEYAADTEPASPAHEE